MDSEFILRAEAVESLKGMTWLNLSLGGNFMAAANTRATDDHNIY